MLQNSINPPKCEITVQSTSSILSHITVISAESSLSRVEVDFYKMNYALLESGLQKRIWQLQDSKFLSLICILIVSFKLYQDATYATIINNKELATSTWINFIINKRSLSI